MTLLELKLCLTPWILRIKSTPLVALGRSLSSVIRSVVSIIFVGVSISACGAGSEKWKEEVKLSDGRIIVVEREKLNERGGGEWASNRSGTKPKEYRIRFADPAGSGQMVEWRTTKISPQTWPEIPLILDVEAAQPIVFSLVAISVGCEVYSKYVYRDGAWVEEALPEKMEKRTTNLFFGDRTNLPTFVNSEEKHKRNSDDRYRHALKQVGPTRKVCG